MKLLSQPISYKLSELRKIINLQFKLLISEGELNDNRLKETEWTIIAGGKNKGIYNIYEPILFSGDR